MKTITCTITVAAVDLPVALAAVSGAVAGAGGSVTFAEGVRPEPSTCRGIVIPPRDRQAIAAALRVLHPTWTQSRIAQLVGIDASRLSRSARFRLAAECVRGDPPPRGTIDGDGNLEAEDPQA